MLKSLYYLSIQIVLSCSTLPKSMGKDVVNLFCETYRRVTLEPILNLHCRPWTSIFILTYDEVLLRATNQLPDRVNWNGDDDDSVNIRIREAYNTCLTKLFSGLGWPAERINQQLTQLTTHSETVIHDESAVLGFKM